jgi:hypothetical protein
MKTVLLFLTFLPLYLNAQMSFDKSIKKLGLDIDKVIYTNETVLLYPRGLIYDLSNPDSVTYFGCLSTDKTSFVNYFENSSESLKLKVGSKINRIAGEFTDSIYMEKINQKLLRFSYSDKSRAYKLNSSTQYVAICYWNSGALDKDLIKNYKYFKKYARLHPELNIQILFVSTDNF